MTQKEVNLTIENTQTQIENNEDEYLTSNTLRIKSMSNLYRIPVFKISQQNIKLPNNSIRTFSNVKIKSCEIIPRLNNITYNNNCLRWLRKVNLEFNEKLLDKWNNNKNIINPYILGDTYPTEQWMLCSIFIEPNYYESVEALVDEINNKISVSLENLFEFTTTTTNIIKNASLNYEPTTTNEAKTLINNAQVINCNLSSLIDSESVYTTKSITYVLNGETTTLENAIITFKGDVKIENVKLGNVSILNPEFEDNKFNIIDENVEKARNKQIYNSTLINENNLHTTNSVYEAFLTNVNCTAIIETSTTKFDEPQNITIKVANIMSYFKQHGIDIMTSIHSVSCNRIDTGVRMFIDFNLQKLAGETSYKIIRSGTIKYIYYLLGNVYAYEGTLVPNMSDIYSDCNITIEYRITTENGVFDDETYHMSGECELDQDDNIILTYSTDLENGFINMYYMFIGKQKDENVINNKTSFTFNNVKYFVTSHVKLSESNTKIKYGIYTFMNTLKCDSSYVKSGTIIGSKGDLIDDVIIYERTAENLDTIKEYTVNKNSDLLFDSYFNELYDTYTNGGKFLTLNNNVLSDVYIFSFKLLPVTVENLIQQNVDEYVKLNKYNIDTITTELLPKVVEYNGDDFVLTNNIFNLNEYDNEESKINTFLYTFSQTNDLSYNMNLSTVKVTVNTKSVLKYNSGYATDEINNEDIIEDIAYIIKGTYYSEFIYNGPVYTKQYYTFNNSNSTLKYNLTETNMDISRLLNDTDIYNNFVATSFNNNNNNTDLSILNKIRIIMTTNFDVEQKINNEDKNLVSTNETNVFEIQTSDTSKLILKSINLNIIIPKDESIYVYIVGSEYNYALMNNNATLEIEYVN